MLELYLDFHDSSFIPFLMSISKYVDCLAVYSSFPLAINRFFRLYFPHLYKKVFSLRKMLFLLFLYDFAICIFLFVKISLNNNIYMEQGLNVVIMSSNIALSILILIKIHQMKKLVRNSTFEKALLSDLCRAAIVCLVQPMSNLFFLCMVIVLISLNPTIYSSPEDISSILISIYLYFSNFQVVVYEIFIVIDACMMLFVLKTYKGGMIFIWNRVSPWKIGAYNVKTTIVAINHVKK